MVRTTIHIVMGTLLWVVFCFYWHLVMQQPISDQTRRALAIVGTIVAVITVFDWFWIFHNVRIARRTRRRGRRADPLLPRTDFLGRTFTAQDEMLRRARYIEVTVVEMADETQSAGHKLFRVSDTVPLD
jgi:hypothetical protein